MEKYNKNYELKYKTLTLEQVFVELSNRFIKNLPEKELASIKKVQVYVEEAHWFYQDKIQVIRPDLPAFPSLKRFSAEMFKHCPLLRPWANRHDCVYDQFLEYRARIPVCGAIILNHALDKCLIVKGWKKTSPWGFPKGKIKEDESFEDCAIREVMEETGLDIRPFMCAQHYLESMREKQRYRLYIVPGVPEDTLFAPRVRNEISRISWIQLDKLRMYIAQARQGVPGPYTFFMVDTFVEKLKSFIDLRRATMLYVKFYHAKIRHQPLLMEKSYLLLLKVPPANNNITIEIKNFNVCSVEFDKKAMVARIVIDPTQSN